MNLALARSGYMPLSGAASRRALVTKLVPRLVHLRIFLATFRDPVATFPQLISPFHPTRRRNLGLDGRNPQMAQTRWRWLRFIGRGQHPAECLRRAGNASASLAQDTRGTTQIARTSSPSRRLAALSCRDRSEPWSGC